MDISEFKMRFGKDPITHFNTQIKILLHLGLLKVTEHDICLADESSISMNIAKAFFVDRDYISRLIKNYDQSYDIGADYMKLMSHLSRS